MSAMFAAIGGALAALMALLLLWHVGNVVRMNRDRRRVSRGYLGGVTIDAAAISRADRVTIALEQLAPRERIAHLLTAHARELFASAAWRRQYSAAAVDAAFASIATESVELKAVEAAEAAWLAEFARPDQLECVADALRRMPDLHTRLGNVEARLAKSLVAQLRAAATMPCLAQTVA